MSQVQPTDSTDAGITTTEDSPTQHLEVERKYKVHGLFRLPPLGELPDVETVRALPPMELLAVYYDTEDLRLARSGITLRRREGGVDDGWHLKLPENEPGARTEHQVPLQAGPSIPESLRELTTAWCRSAALQPVATLRTERRAYELLSGGNDLLAELTDDTVSVLDGDHVAARFREVEVEISGRVTSQTLDDLDARLRHAGAIQGTFTSKVSRALGPASAAPPDVPDVPAATPNDPAGDAVRAYLATQVRALLRQDPRVRLGLDDAVHQMRVAARRMRSGMKVFAPLLDADWSDPLRAELAWLAGALGAARDREVLEARLLRDLQRLPEHAEADEASAVVVAALEDGMADARAQALAALRSPRYLALLDSLLRAANDPPLTQAAADPAKDVLPPLVAKSWTRLAKDVRKLGLRSPDEPWHETRIAAKRVRYAAEAVAPTLGADAAQFAERMESLTELLGEHQDAAVAADEVHALAHRPHVSGSAGFALGELYGLQRDACAAVRRRFLKRWPQAAHPRHRRWLGAQ